MSQASYDRAIRRINEFSTDAYSSTLDLSNMRLTQLPPEVADLQGVRVLNIEDNNLKELPWEMRKLRTRRALRELYLHGNQSLGIPPEILGPRHQQVHAPVLPRPRSSEVSHRSYSTIVGYWRASDTPYSPPTPATPANILDYYFRTRQEPSKQLNQAKLLVLGQGGVGKTSLVNRLLRNKFDENEVKTEGIDIAHWNIPGGKASEGNAQIRLNVWDFGGQDIMHATHQFFLTKRSLYLIVLDARKGENEGNIHYWLKIAQSYGGDSPAIVVTNKCESHYLELNETRLAKDYSPNLIGFFQVSCKTGENISKLRNALQQQVRKLEHVYDRLPISYFQVKEQLEEEARIRDYLDVKEYHRLCRKHDVTKSADQKMLLRFLHDLGSVLNFDDPDDPYKLRDMNILNPEWVTTGVYAILNSNMLMQKGGILRRGQLHSLLIDRDRYPKDRYAFILEVMRKFELCFSFPESDDRMLIPELLPRNEPELEWHKDTALNFEFHYRILPSGMICRFIVRMHKQLTNRPTYWRSGCVLNIEGCKTLVRADTESGRLYVAITGPVNRRREALAIVRHVLKSIHSTIPKLDVSEMVPLPDDPEVCVPFSHLVTLEGRGIHTLVPQGKDEYYSVLELLHGIEDRTPFDVFLSYHSRDADWVKNLKCALQEKQIKVWLDQDEIRPGDQFVDALEKGLEMSAAVAIVVSQEGTLSGWVKEEYHRAMDLHKTSKGELRIIPVMLGDVKSPGFLSSRQSVRFKNADSFSADVSKLAFGITGKKPS